MSIAIFFKLNIPKVQDTSDNSKEMLITRDIALEKRFPQLNGMVLIFPTHANKQNISWAEGGESDNLLQRYATTSHHHAVPRYSSSPTHSLKPPKMMSYSILDTSPKQDFFHHF